MTRGHDDNRGKEEREQRQVGDAIADIAGRRPTLGDFRRRVDAFWGDPRADGLRQSLGRGVGERGSLPPVSALSSSQADTLAILESRPDEAEFRLQKSLRLRDGQLAAISGDERPLAADDRILVVTTTTTVMDADSVSVETDVLVFEREA
jgi:hypothetical protein